MYSLIFCQKGIDLITKAAQKEEALEEEEAVKWLGLGSACLLDAVKCK